MLTRIAAAMLVDPEDGVPVILDDALGFSDPQRLAVFNSLLGRVRENAQAVLTCWPDRFSGVPGQRRRLLREGE